MNLDYLIFGGSGFIGTHISNYLNNTGESFFIADIIKPVQNDFTFEFSDVRKKISLNLEKSSVDTIINLAAVHKTPGHNHNEYFDTNIKGAMNVCDFARKNNINTIIFTSSIAVYGTYEEKKSEQTLPMPDIPYGISKLTAEYIHKQWYSEDPANRRLLILRPGVVFGMYEKANFTRLINSLNGRYFVYVGRKDTKKACVYVKDLVHALMVISKDKSIKYEIFNVAYSPTLSIEKIVRSVSKIGGFKLPRFVFPKLIVFFLSSILYYIFKKKDFNPSRMNKLIVSNNIDAKKINKMIKFNFGFSKGIADWMDDVDFKNNKKIY